LGLALTLDETLVQGRMGKRYAQSSGASETPTTKVIPPRDGRFLMALSSPLRPFARLPRYTSPLNIVSPPDYLGRLALPGLRARDSSLATSSRILTSPTDELLDITLKVSNLIDLGGIS